MKLDPQLLENRNQNRSTVVARHGMVCTSQPLAALAGVDVLRAGGNAVDAAVCVNAALSVVEPMNCGPGGDLFAIVWMEREGKLYGLNASGRSPYGWTLEAARQAGLKSIPEHGVLSWSVPGCVSGWETLLRRFGRRSLADVLAPAIAYAREGFSLTPVIARDWVFDPRSHPTLAETYMPAGRKPSFGGVYANPALAGVFELVAKEGAGAFYRGEIAERIVRYSQSVGGHMSLRDFADHEATWVDPVSTAYRGYDVCEIPPNGQGIAVLQILNLLELFDIGSMKSNTARPLHLLIEAKKLAYEDRARYYADPDFAEVPIEWLISKEYAEQRRKLINRRQAAARVGSGAPAGGLETVYLATADDEGNMVSLIQSIFAGWGSHIVPDGLGFAMQNRGMSFALNPKHRNRLEPHKRPFHTIIPAFVTRNGRPQFAFGVVGGDFQPQGQAQVLMNLIDFGMSPQQAGEQPRIWHEGSSTPTGRRIRHGGTIGFERGFDEQVKEALAALGHRIRRATGAVGGYQGIWREEGPRRYFGASDSRKDGAAIGF
jgi:gamma-glutamyltranspeptidase/glutathione hydrolase